jgi:hypothetical protein
MTLKIENLSGNARDFAEACYDTNSDGELVRALAAEPDTRTMSDWKLSERAYYSAISAALNEMRERTL